MFALASTDSGGNLRTAERAEDILGVPTMGGAQWSVITTINPDQARRLLQTMPSQRPPRIKKITEFADAMRAGLWQVTHQGLAIDEHGRISDGQHRLNAIVAAGQPIAMQVTFNVSRKAFEVFDRGAPRSLGDDLAINGFVEGGTKSRTLSAAVRIVIHYDNGAPLNAFTGAGKDAPSLELAQQCLRAHPMLQDTVDEYSSPAMKIGAPAVLCGYLTLMREKDNNLATAFAHRIMTGEDMKSGDPEFAFRDAVRNRPRLTDSGRADFAVRLIRAWNARRHGRAMPVGKLYGNIKEAHAFPKIV